MVGENLFNRIRENRFSQTALGPEEKSNCIFGAFFRFYTKKITNISIHWQAAWQVAVAVAECPLLPHTALLQ